MDDQKQIGEQHHQANTDNSNTSNNNSSTKGKAASKEGMLGLGLVGIGLLAVLTNVGDESGFLWTGMISAVMFFAYYRTKAYGLLIPACILAGVTAGIILELISPVEGVFLLGLGAGFVAIDRIEQHKTRWPLYPGIILIAIGTVITVQTLFNNMLFALMLIVVGAYLLLRNRQVLDSMVDIKADVDIRIGEDDANKEGSKKSTTKTFASEDYKAKDAKSEERKSEERKPEDVNIEGVAKDNNEAKTVVVDIMSEDAVSGDAKDVKVVDIDTSTAGTADDMQDDNSDEVIELNAKSTGAKSKDTESTSAKSTDANVKDLDEAVSNIKKAVDKIVEDANLPKDDDKTAI